MITLTLTTNIGRNSFSFTEHHTFIIHKPRTNTDILIENLQQVYNSLGATFTATSASVKSSTSVAKNLGLSGYLLLSNPTIFSIQHKPQNLLLNCTSLTKSNFKFLPAHESAKYGYVNSRLNTRIRYNIFVVKTRTMQAYNALEKLSNNSHLIPNFEDVRKQLRLIKYILQKENEVVN